MLVSINSTLLNVTEFFPSIITPSDALETSLALLTVIDAVEYIAGEPWPFVVYIPPSTFIIPPPLSLLIAADDIPEVVMFKLLATIFQPPVAIIPPELSCVVVIVESLIVTLVPSPLELFVVALPP